MKASEDNGGAKAKNGHIAGKAGLVKQRASNVGGVTGKGFVKGKSGNPNGRPRRAETLGAAIREFADRLKPKDRQGRTYLQVLIAKLYDKDPKTFLAYGFGKPVEMIELSGAEGSPVEFRLAVGDSDLPLGLGRQ